MTHAIIHKKVINHDRGGSYVLCAWADCEKDGYELFKVRVNYGTSAAPHVLNYVFCSERHRQYFVHSHRAYGHLPPGHKMSVI